MYRTIAFFAMLTASISCSFISDSAAQQAIEKALIIRGASTVASLIQPWVTEFEKDNPNTRILVTASTQGEGFEALLNGSADLCMTARKLDAEERTRGAQKGIQLAEVNLVNDAVAIIVNRSNPVDKLTIEQLAKAFGGEFSNWNQIGGKDEPIQVITMPAFSAMASFLSKDVFKRIFDPKSTIVDLPRDLPKYVTSKQGALGFCRTDLALAPGAAVKVLAISRNKESPAVQLSRESVKDGSFPILRPLGFCCDETKLKGSLKAFADFCKRKAEQSTTDR